MRKSVRHWAKIHQTGSPVQSAELGRTCRSIIIIVAVLFWCSVPPLGQSWPQDAQRRVTVADGITMTTLADPTYLLTWSSKGRVAQFSPDGKQFVVVLRRGNLEQNTNQYSMLFYRTAEVFNSPKPQVLVTMASSSNRPGITNVKWIDGAQSITFLGEGIDQFPKVYRLNLHIQKRVELTHHSTAVLNYDVSPDGKVVA